MHVSITMPQSRRYEANVGGYVHKIEPRHHRVLEILLLKRNQYVNVDQFVELIWENPDEQPDSARAMVRLSVLYLRDLGIIIYNDRSRGYSLPDLDP